MEESLEREQSQEEEAQEEQPQEGRSWFARLGEDWLAVIVGLALVLLTWIGVIVEAPWPLLGFLK